MKLLLLFAAASSVPACVVPVSPEFQDPPGAPNAQPLISNPSFFPGSAVANTTMQEFSFTVMDPNGDPMFLRWVSDFPPFDQTTTRQIVVNTNALPANSGSTRIVEMIHCGDVFPGFSTHMIVAAVADRDFNHDPTNPIAVDPPGLVSVIPWTLTLTCPAPQ